MELRGGGQQDKRLPGGVPSSFSYGFTSLVAERSESRRRDHGSTNINGPAAPPTLNPSSSQTLDPHILLHHHHHHRQNHHFHHQDHHQNHPSSSSSSQPQQSHSHEEPPPPAAAAAAARDPNNNPDPDPSDHQGGPFVPVLSVAAVVGSSPTPTVRYRECLKNHAASIGSHVVDGCGEFMPSGEEGTPGSLKCAACDCHRNFHRKEVEGESQSVTTSCYFCHNRNNKTDTNNNNNNRSAAPLHPPRLPRQTQAAAPPPQPPPPSAFRQRHQRFSSKLRNSPPQGPRQPVMMAFGGGGGSGSGGGGGGGGGGESSSEEQDLNAYQSNVGSGQDQQPMSKKRFRTKFSQEQKDKMVEFADKIGWRFQKQYEDEIQHFCGEVGVKRQVLKVWMHNNKNTMKKKEL